MVDGGRGLRRSIPSHGARVATLVTSVSARCNGTLASTNKRGRVTNRASAEVLGVSPPKTAAESAMIKMAAHTSVLAKAGQIGDAMQVSTAACAGAVAETPS